MHKLGLGLLIVELEKNKKCQTANPYELINSLQQAPETKLFPLPWHYTM